MAATATRHGPAAVPDAWVHLLHRAGYAAEPLEAQTTEQTFVDGLLAIAAMRDVSSQRSG